MDVLEASLPVASRTPTLRHIGTRTGIAEFRAGQIKTIMSETVDWLSADTTAIIIKWANFLANLQGEQPGGVCQLRASFSLDNGATFTQLTFANGSTPNTTTFNGDDDYPATVLSPAVGKKHQKIIVRQWYANDAGILYNENANRVLDEGAVFFPIPAAQAVDATQGDFTPVENQLFRPAVILAVSNVPSVAIFGDSKSVGHEVAAKSKGTSGQIVPSISQVLPVLNLSAGGDNCNSWVDSSSRRRELSQYVTDIVMQLGFNDVYTRSSPATNPLRDRGLIAGLVNAAYAGKRFHATTITVRTASTDGWATKANQTVDSRTPEQVIFNNTTLGYPAWVNGQVFDINAVTENPKFPGFWRTVEGQSMTDDGIHENQSGNETIVASGVVTPTHFAY